MNIALIGGGNMGMALALGLQNSDLDCSVRVAEPIEAQRERFAEQNIQTYSDNVQACAKQDIVILAVKPQVIGAVCQEIAPHTQGCLILSIAAGTTLTQLSSWFGENAPVVRAMPNTPALIGEGVTGLIASSAVKQEQRSQAEQIFSTCGVALWFDTDDQLNAVTALSGSGPAYFFYLIEAMVQAGEDMGLSRTQALDLVQQTAMGASCLLTSEDTDPATLRHQVTSPGGTTEAAIRTLDEHDAMATIRQAVIAAYQRANDLAS